MSKIAHLRKCAILLGGQMDEIIAEVARAIAWFGRLFALSRLLAQGIVVTRLAIDKEVCSCAEYWVEGPGRV